MGNPKVAGAFDYRFFFERSEDGLAIGNSDNVIVECNLQLCRMLGYEKDELVGKPVSEISHPEDMKINESESQKLQQGLLSEFEMEKRYISKSGDVIPARLYLKVVRDKSGTIEYYMAQIRDMRPHLEMKHAYENLYRAGDLARVGHWEYYPEEGILNWSDITKKIHAVPDDHVPAINDAIEFFKKGESRDKILFVVKRAIEEGIGYDEEFEFVSMDGMNKWVRSVGYPEFKDGKCVRLSGVFQDISERKRAERVLLERKANEQALQDQLSHRSRLEAIGELAAGVGHEINNPLTIAYGNLIRLKGMMEDRAILDEKLSKCFMRQEDSLKRIRNIVKGLRTYARQDSADREVLDGHELIKNVTEMVGEMYSKDGVSLSCELGAKKFQVFGHPGKYQQVVMNLVSNAKDALEATEDKKIIISSSCTERSFILEVADNGMGVPEENKAKIFSTFFTTKPIGKGTGLGLGIVSKILNEMDSNINMISEVGKGTRFIVEFPLAEIAVNSKSKEKRERSPVSSAEKFRFSLNVLVVDDEEGVCELLQDLLESRGMHVQWASDLGKAKTMMATGAFDVVFTDKNLGSERGEDLVRWAKEAGYGDCKFVLVSATSELEEDSNRMRLIFDHLIAKPFEESEVFEFFNLFFKVARLSA